MAVRIETPDRKMTVTERFPCHHFSAKEYAKAAPGTSELIDWSLPSDSICEPLIDVQGDAERHGVAFVIATISVLSASISGLLIPACPTIFCESCECVTTGR